MKILIEDYQTNWAHDFLVEKNIIVSTLVDFNPAIEHIGSTSMVGLCAKPTIDILVGLQDQIQLNGIIAPMTSQGYTYFKKYEADMPHRRQFAKLKPLKNEVMPVIIDTHDTFV